MEKRGVLLFAILACTLFFCGLTFAVDTELNIDNPPPYLTQLISNQSWAGGNLSEVFDLDDYFNSVTNSTLSYSYSGFSGITTFIDSNNSVSFYPPLFFSGITTGYFYADDGSQNGSSNEVYLFIAVDSEPPKWVSIEKDTETIYQNDYVQFSSNWTDNYGLMNYTLSINQGSGYSNYSRSFRGLFNQSRESVQISASSGNTVYWFFCASDLSGNPNCTSEENFTVLEKEVPVTPPVIANNEKESVKDKIKEALGKDVKGFEVSVSSFLVSLKQGSTQTKVLEIKNTGNTDLNFNLSITGLSEFAVLSSNFLVVPSGETKKVSIDFFSKEDTLPGQYFGSIAIVSVTEVSVPIIFEINSLESDAEVLVEVPEEYKFVKPGHPVAANITIKNLKDPIEGGVNLHLSIIDFSGNVYDSSDEIVSLSSTVSFMRNFTTPSDLLLSEYVFHARISKEDSVLSIASDTFEVGVRFKFLAFVKSSSIFLLIVLLSLFSVLLVLRYRSLVERKETLGFYVQSLELRKLMALGKFDEAVSLFIKMKNACGEPITKEMLEDKEGLKAQMKILAGKFNLDENSVLNPSRKEVPVKKDEKAGEEAKIPETAPKEKKESNEKKEEAK